MHEERVCDALGESTTAAQHRHYGASVPDAAHTLVRGVVDLLSDHVARLVHRERHREVDCFARAFISAGSGRDAQC